MYNNTNLMFILQIMAEVYKCHKESTDRELITMLEIEISMS